MTFPDWLSDWRVWVSAAIGLCITAGPLLAIKEIRWMRRTGKWSRQRAREMWLSLSPLPLNLAVTTALAGVWASVYAQAHEHALSSLPIGFATIVAAFLAVDFSYYWEHRCAHRLRWLWGLYHAIHHSSHEYTIATAYRVSFVNQALAPAFYLPWILLGLHPALIVALQLLAFHYQAWLHTEMIGPLGRLDAWFNTPAAHRLHHSAAIEHRDRNLGAITLLWDRLFGTYAECASSLRYGIPGVDSPTSTWAMFAEPWSLWLCQPSRRDAAVRPRQRKTVRM